MDGSRQPIIPLSDLLRYYLFILDRLNTDMIITDTPDNRNELAIIICCIKFLDGPDPIIQFNDGLIFMSIHPFSPNPALAAEFERHMGEAAPDRSLSKAK